MALNLTTAAALLPSCALSCISQAVGNNTCPAALDLPCVCSTEPFNAFTTACVESACTKHQQLTTLNVTSTRCGVDPNVNSYYLTVSPVFLALTVLAVALRFIARLTRRLNFWWDDVCALFGLAGCIIFTSTTLSQRSFGLGRQIWSVPQDDIAPLLHLAYIHFPVYAITGFFIRECILLFYIRIFGRTKLLIGAVILQLFACIPFVIVDLMICSPPSTFWDDWDDATPKNCINFEASVIAGAGISTAMDMWIILLSVPYLWKLNMGFRKKVEIGAMFFLGMFTTAVSVARFPSIPQLASATNPTADLVPIAVWSALELNVGLICACLPSIRTLLLHLLPPPPSDPTNPNRPRTSSSATTMGGRGGGPRLADITWGAGTATTTTTRARGALFGGRGDGGTRGAGSEVYLPLQSAGGSVGQMAMPEQVVYGDSQGPGWSRGPVGYGASGETGGV